MGETWVVTGAGRGIGLELVRRLHAAGHEVIGTARDVEGAKELRGLTESVLSLDVAQPASVEAFARELAGRKIDALVNNAGVYGGRQSLGDLDVEDMARVFDVNALGPLRVTAALLPSLRAGGRRLVVQITSKMGSIADNSSGGVYGYRASKAALNMINKSLALDLAGEGFTCLVVHPGWVRTSMGGAAAPLGVEESAAGILAVIGRAGPEQSGRFFAFDGSEIPW